MNLGWWISTYFLGMASQAVISAALFPDGIDPDQQRFAAVIFAALAVIFAALAVVLNRQSKS